MRMPPRHKCPECNAFHHNDSDRELVQDHYTNCAECGKTCGQDYMVKTEVWEASGTGYHDGSLHLACLAKRLGRPLTIDDFETYKCFFTVNAPFFLGVELGKQTNRKGDYMIETPEATPETSGSTSDTAVDKEHPLTIVGNKITKWSYYIGMSLVFFGVARWLTNVSGEEVKKFALLIWGEPMILGWVIFLTGLFIGLVLFVLGNSLSKRAKKKANIDG